MIESPVEAIELGSGTVWAVRRIFDLLQLTGTLVEWWEEAGTPYTYRLRINATEVGVTLHVLQQPHYVSDYFPGHAAVLAAGDDLNDISMLQAADIKIVMPAAPKEMHPMATILANDGIIEALKLATQHA